jgi:hypothetical protein
MGRPAAHVVAVTLVTGLLVACGSLLSLQTTDDPPADGGSGAGPESGALSDPREAGPPGDASYADAPPDATSKTDSGSCTNLGDQCTGPGDDSCCAADAGPVACVTFSGEYKCHACARLNDACSFDLPCCGALSCGKANVCCLFPGAISCSTSADCCSGTCSGDFCVP